MPDHGLLTQEVLPHTGPANAPLYPPAPWKLPGSHVLKVMFETDVEPLLKWLPSKLTRSYPPYAVIAVSHHPDSPVGPFSLATQHLGCRAGFFIRAFTVQAVANTMEAVSGLRELWGYPCRLGEVSVEADGTSARGVVSFGGRTVLELGLSDFTSMQPDSARLDPILNVRTVPSVEEGKKHDLVQLLQIDPDYTISDTNRGRASVTYPEGGGDNDWAALACRNVISAISCEIETELPLARFVMAY